MADIAARYPKPNIVEVVEALGGVMSGPDRGGWRACRCPIHDDRTASAAVHEDDCRFKCFTCDFSGDAVDLIMEAEHVGFADAFERAKGFATGGSGDLREVRGRSSLLPHGTRSNQAGGTFIPPWKSL